MMKKIISAILALAMCMSMMGGAAALDTDATTSTVTYTFSKTKLQTLNDVASLNTKGGTNSYNDVVFWDSTRGIGNFLSHWFPSSVVDFGNHGWKYFGVGADIESLMDSNNGNSFRMLQFGADYQVILNSNSNSSLALEDGKTAKLAYELQKPNVAGYYKVIVNSQGVRNDTNPTANFYMNPYSDALTTDGSATEKALLDTVSYTDTNAVDKELTKIIYVDDEDNLIFTMNPHQKPTAGTYTNNGINVYSAKLTRVDGEPTFSISRETLNASDRLTKTAQIEVKVGTNTVANSFVRYTVKDGDANVASVDGNGVVTAHAKGTETIVAAVGEESVEFDIEVVDFADKTYYFAKKGDIKQNNVVVNTLTVGVDYTLPGVLDTSIIDSKVYAASIGGFGTHGWKYYDINDLVFEEYKAGQPRLFQANADNLRLNGTYITNTTDLEIRAALELEAPTKQGFYTIYTNTNTAGINFYTGPKKTVIIEGEEVKDVENYINGAHLVGTTVENSSTYATDGDDIAIDRQTAPVMAVYSDGETSMILAYQVPNTTSIDLRGYKLTYIENADPVVKCGDAIGKNISVELRNNNRGRIQVRTAETGGAKVTDSFVSYESNNPEVLEVDDAGVIEAVSVGEATVTATIAGKALTVKVKVYEDDPELKTAFTHNERDDSYTYVAPSMTGLTIGGYTINADKNANGSYDIEAPEKDEDGDNFLYWAKGMETRKKIVSFERKLEGYVPENNGTNFIIAVYEGDITDTTTPEYYNIDGQLIAKSNTEPEYPSIPGLGTAIAWKDCGGNIKVAEYEDTVRDNVTVTVEGGTGTQENVPYGTIITCTAESEDTDGKPFKCWKKTLDNGATEIVSIDSIYEFNAWESCTVTAVYEEYTFNGTAMKIIIDSFDVGSETGVMAEFIGLSDAVEKGIMFTDSDNKTTKIAMTTKDNQFTVVADEPGKYVGYAILKNETAHTLITDGSYEHN